MTRPIDDFIEQMGMIAQADGAPRIAGQILGYLLIEGRPRTLGQMAEALKISKASASTNARLLELKGAVRRVSPVGQRGDAYQALDEPNIGAMRALADRYRASAETIGAIAARFPASQIEARARVMRYAAFNREAAACIDGWIAEAADCGARRTGGHRS